MVAKHVKKGLIISIFLVVILFLVSCSKNNNELGGDIPLTDLASTYEGEATDAEGNLLAPFDVVYPEAFSSGEYKYDESVVLLKMKKDFNGQLSKNLENCGIEKIEKFMTGEDGDWYRATINSKTDAITVMKKARSLKEVLVVDLDYIYENAVEEEWESVGPTTDCTDLLNEKVKNNENAGQQWYLTHCDIQKAWKFLEDEGIEPGGLSSVTVAVIDTGVDYNHPDLKANMWVNSGEIAGNGVDDDGNGYVDDIHGVNVIANNGSGDMANVGNPMDDHGHGTHVAGIIAASNNKAGIVGIAYNAKIMAVKAGQATGVFLQSDIAEAILYSYQMGADVINMSFGGSACSIAVQDALTQAYTTAILVASAGNDGLPNEKTLKCPALLNYPGALSYVIGVMSVGAQGKESSFTNWDYVAYNYVEYEVYAPGEQILSTLPNNRYGKMSGTSMAAPVVSGIAALLRSYFTDRDMYPSKFIAAQIAATSEDEASCFDPEEHLKHNLPMIVNAFAALTKLPKPDVKLNDYYLFDDLELSENNNGDGVIDAGEIVNIGAVLRNRWGMSKDTVITIDSVVFTDTGLTNPYIEIITDSVDFGGGGTYSPKDVLTRNGSIVTGCDLPLVIKIKENCPNDYLINLNVRITCQNALDEDDNTIYNNYQKEIISFWVRNGVVLPSQITEDMTLTKDNYYIIPNGTYIPEGVTVTVEEGAQIQFWSDDTQDPYAETYIAYLKVAGNFITKGTIDEPVILFPSEVMSQYIVEIKKEENGYVELEYTTITNPVIEGDFIDHCTFKINFPHGTYRRYYANGFIQTTESDILIECNDVNNSLFYKLSSSAQCRIRGTFNTCSFVDSSIWYESSILENCVFSGNSTVTKNDRIELSRLVLDDYSLSFNNVLYNDKTGTSYVIINYRSNYVYQDFNLIDYLSTSVSKKFFETIGAHLACIETTEELKFICESFSENTIDRTLIGLDSSTMTWGNGEKYDLDYPNSDDGHKYAYLSCVGSEVYLTDDILSSCLLEIPNDEIKKNTGYSIESLENCYEAFKYYNGFFYNNVILNNFNHPDSWLKVEAGVYENKFEVGASGNYWGTIDEKMINNQILDFDDFMNFGDIIYSDYLTTAPSNTFPFVTNLKLYNSDGDEVTVVSNETIRFVVEFNRDMDVTIPLRLRFGSSMPYAEYEISGQYIDARTWEGTYTIKTTIENGNQFFNISNGSSADDHYLGLYETQGRFSFEIDTYAAQAMIMQADPTEEGIHLTWMQDDFETLAGYNVYRSDAEDGYYQRLNDYVLSPDTKEFLDDTVEPGKVYHYNFTVVQTDLTESTPSGKVSVRSLDTMAPNIYHSPVHTAYTNSNLIISATITDNLQITTAYLYYRVAESSEWRRVVMNGLNSRYTGVISSEYITTEGLEYYIKAYDGISYTYKGNEEDPYTVEVRLAVDKNSMGDVDGDGVIAIKDALMLLQAANDQLNLTEEQFKRADLNEDGVLSAAEALRILQYVSGKITSILE